VSRVRSTVLLGIGFVLAGAAFDSASLYVPGIGLVLLALGALAWVELAAKGARLSLAPGPPTVVEGQPYPIRIDVRAGSVPLRAELNHPLLERQATVAIRRPHETKAIRSEVSFPRRGRRSLGPVSLRIRDPLHLHQRELEGDAHELLVLPRTEAVRASEGAGGDRGEDFLDRFVFGAGGPGLDASAIDVEIDGVRPYRDGSPATRIHWPTVARSGELVERRLVAGGTEAPLVVLDASQPPSETELDKAVRAAASLCLHLARLGGCALLLAGDRQPQRVDRQLRAWPSAHARLALVQAGTAPPALARSATGTVFWVTPAPPRGGLVRNARNACVVTPNPLRTLPALFEVAGCCGQAIGTSRAQTVRARSAA
jgi:uncharacterized protein (DUF58 family)